MTTTRGDDRIDAGTLWAGGAAAAVVAALLVILGVLTCRGVLDIAILAPAGDGLFGDADTGSYAVGAALTALLATGVMHLLLLCTSRPAPPFGWIMTLLTAVAIVTPFTVQASAQRCQATAAINLTAGLAIGGLVSASARSAARRAAPRTGRPVQSQPAR